MANLNELWKKRLWGFWEEAIRYLRIITMGYFYFPILLIIGLGFIYQYLSKHLPSSFPIEWVLSFFFAWMLARIRPRTFLEEADLIFLLPVQHRMGTYFRNALIYTFLIYSIEMIALFALLSPLFSIYLSGNGKVLPYLVPVLFLLLWNIFLGGQEIKYRQPAWIGFMLLRFMANLLVCLHIFRVFSSYWVIDLFVLLLIAFLYWKNGKEGNYHWNFLLLVERGKRSSFYSFIHWFMETPQRQTFMVHKKSIWIHFRWLPYQPGLTYFYFYFKSLMRDREIFFPYLRLLIISSILMVWNVPLYLSLIMVLLALMLNGLQLYQAWPRLNYFWFRLYPLPKGSRESGFLKSLFILLGVHVTGMAVVATWAQGLEKGCLLWLIGILFQFGWVYLWIRKKVKFQI